MHIFQQYHLSRIDGAFIHRLRQSPTNCQCKSVVIKSPNCSARGTGLPVRFLQRAVVILVLFAYFAVSVLRDVRENTVYPIPDVLKVLDEVVHEKCLRVHPLMLTLCPLSVQ